MHLGHCSGYLPIRYLVSKERINMLETEIDGLLVTSNQVTISSVDGSQMVDCQLASWDVCTGNASTFRIKRRTDVKEHDFSD